MEYSVLTTEDQEGRSCWIKRISELSDDFSVNTSLIEQGISQETEQSGITPLIGHLRFCGAIPEYYDHDSTEEKLYSKYTDIVIHRAYVAIGLESTVLTERADAADVECACDAYSFVADAKAFRLSRTAKNQKDFKVQAMDNWKYGKPFAMVVCPIYQLPSRNSQIYQQAASRSVCVLSYTHLAVLVRYEDLSREGSAIHLLHEIFRTVEAMNPSKDATSYWQAINRTLLSGGHILSEIWMEEKVASVESIHAVRHEALDFLAQERERILRLSKTEAINEVLNWRKIAKRVHAVRSVVDNGLLEIG